jgi:hypothetical protein
VYKGNGKWNQNQLAAISSLSDHAELQFIIFVSQITEKKYE